MKHIIKEIRPKLLLITNRNCMRFRLTPGSMTLYDLELLSVRIFERIARDFADFGGNNS